MSTVWRFIFIALMPIAFAVSGTFVLFGCETQLDDPDVEVPPAARETSPPSTRSAPPDTTHYVRPLVEGDLDPARRARTPHQAQVSGTDVGGGSAPPCAAAQAISPAKDALPDDGCKARRP